MKLRHPSFLTLSGPSGSGKTTIVRAILENLETVYPDVRFSHVIYCYGVASPTHPRHLDFVEFHEGPPHMEMLKRPGHKLIINDDLAEFFKANPSQLSNLACRASHHCSASVIHISQSLFAQERTSRCSSQYICLCKSKSDKLTAMNLARQIFPSQPKRLLEVINDIDGTKYGHVLIDLHPESLPEHMLYSNIFSPKPHIYLPRQSI